MAATGSCRICRNSGAHRKSGVRERHYEVFRRALIAMLQRFAAPRWNETAKNAPETAFNQVH